MKVWVIFLCLLVVVIVMQNMSPVYVVERSSRRHPRHKRRIGNHRDRHGCLASAGYSWSDRLHQCVRWWEEPIYPDLPDLPDKPHTPETPEERNIIIRKPVIGGNRDEHGCLASGGYSWSEDQQKCVRPWLN